MPVSELFALSILAALVWFWFDSLTAREIAIRAVRSACHSEQLQLLDETIAIDTVRLARSESGALAIRRIYQFEYSNTGSNRLSGTVHLLGTRVTLLDIGVLVLTKA